MFFLNLYFFCFLARRIIGFRALSTFSIRLYIRRNFLDVIFYFYGFFYHSFPVIRSLARLISISCSFCSTVFG